MGIPFAFWPDYGWVTPFITAVVTFLLLGVENIGIQIEEPFEVLPIQAISDACIAGVHEVMERHAGELSRLTHLREGAEGEGYPFGGGVSYDKSPADGCTFQPC